MTSFKASVSNFCRSVPLVCCKHKHEILQVNGLFKHYAIVYNYLFAVILECFDPTIFVDGTCITDKNIAFSPVFDPDIDHRCRLYSMSVMTRLSNSSSFVNLIS